jgi:nucleoside-diphosphate-sugar epimerase
MKITVTGAVGRLGRFVVRALHAEGHEIVATDRIFTRELPVRVEVLNLSDTDRCYRLLEGSDVLIHLGNIPGVNYLKPQADYLNNVGANMNVFQAARDTGVGKILFASSVQAFSGERYVRKDGKLPPSRLPYLPLDGHMPANPGNLYGVSKIEGEDLLAFYAKHYGISAVAIRFPFLPDPALAESDLERVRRVPLLDEGFSYLALPDAASLAVAMVKADLPGFRVYLPASPGTTQAPMSVEEIVARYYPEVPRRAPSNYDNLVDVGEITRDTGWIPQCRIYGA